MLIYVKCIFPEVYTAQYTKCIQEADSATKTEPTVLPVNPNTNRQSEHGFQPSCSAGTSTIMRNVKVAGEVWQCHTTFPWCNFSFDWNSQICSVKILQAIMDWVKQEFQNKALWDTRKYAQWVCLQFTPHVSQHMCQETFIIFCAAEKKKIFPSYLSNSLSQSLCNGVWAWVMEHVSQIDILHFWKLIYQLANGYLRTLFWTFLYIGNFSMVCS